MGELVPSRDSHTVVVRIIRPSIGRDLGGAEPREVTLPCPSVVLFISRVLTEATLCPRARRLEGLSSSCN
jgi:hypothetical protein